MFKETPKEKFSDLDLITKLMQATSVKRKEDYTGYRGKEGPPSIEVLESATFVAGSASKSNVADGENDNDDMGSPAAGGRHNDDAELLKDVMLSKTKKTPYGFNQQYTNFLVGISTEFPCLTRIPLSPGPEQTPIAERKRLRELEENENFDPEKYMCDFVGCNEDPIYMAAVAFNIDSAAASSSPVDAAELKRLPNKEYLMRAGGVRETRTLCSLADILCAYAYDRRLTSGDPTVESGWTVWTLSSTLSWMDVFDSVEDALRASLHRSLTFPYLRSWTLSTLALRDTSAVLKLGRRAVLKWLLRIRGIFKRDEQRYLLNRLYLDDYCVWIQKISDATLARFSDAVVEAMPRLLRKDEIMRWRLTELENYIVAACEELKEEDTP